MGLRGRSALPKVAATKHTHEGFAGGIVGLRRRPALPKVAATDHKHEGFAGGMMEGPSALLHCNCRGL